MSHSLSAVMRYLGAVTVSQSQHSFQQQRAHFVWTAAGHGTRQIQTTELAHQLQHQHFSMIR